MDWLGAAQQLRHDGEPGVLVTVAEVRGHAPREAGAKMVVSRDRTWGSVGGGNLEASVVARARELIESGTGEPEMRETQLSPHARTEHGRQCCGGVVRLLLEPLAVRPVIAVFGLGHVGYELARILSRLPVRLLLADSRAGAAGPGPARRRDRRHRGRRHLPHAARRAGTRAAAARRARRDHDARPRGGLRPVRCGPAAAAAARRHRADRLERQVDSLRGPAGRRRARPRGDHQDHLPDRPARHHRQGPGRDRRRRRLGAADGPG